jgi:hypothetical protein
MSDNCKLSIAELKAQYEEEEGAVATKLAQIKERWQHEAKALQEAEEARKAKEKCKAEEAKQEAKEAQKAKEEAAKKNWVDQEKAENDKADTEKASQKGQGCTRIPGRRYLGH